MHGISTGAGFGSFGSIRNTLMPSQNNLNTWLKSATTDGKTLTNVEGTNATFTGTNALTFDGSDDFIQANNTGLGAGNFYYETIFKFDWEDGDYIFIDGDTSTNNRWFALQYRAGSRGLNFVVDADGTKTTYEIFNSSEVSDTDIVKIVVKREGSTITSQGFNLTQDSSTTDAHTSSGNFSGGNKLTIGALWSGSGASGFAPMELYSFKAGTSETDLLTHYTCAEGSGDTIFDISGQGNHATNTGATRTTEASQLIVSHNNLNGFDKDIFRGYTGYWDDLSGGTGTWVANANNLTLTGNTGVSDKLRQSVYGLVSGDTLVVSGTVVQTGATGGSNQDLAISSASAGWTQGSVFLGGEIGTYTFSTTLNANSSTCDIQFVVLNAAQVVISDLKFIVVKKIPALINKTKQLSNFDGTVYIQSITDSATKNFFGAATITTTLNIVNTSTTEVINALGGASYRLYIASGNWHINTTNTGVSVSAGKQTLEITFNSDGHGTELKINDSSVYTGTTSDYTLSASGGLQIGARAGGLQFTGKMHSWKLVNASGTYVEYDFQNNIGTATIKDVSGNSRDGTLQSPTLTDFWKEREVDSTGSIVGADYAVGNTSVSNPSGYVHNGSECGLDLITTDVSASDIASINNASATQTFAKRDATNSELVTQLLQYSSTISGGDLVRTRRYVS